MGEATLGVPIPAMGTRRARMADSRPDGAKEARVFATARRAMARAIGSALPLLTVAAVLGDYGKRW